MGSDHLSGTSMPAMPPPPTPQRVVTGLRHEALLYAGESAFIDAVSGLVSEGRSADEPVAVVLPTARLKLIRHPPGPVAGDDRVHLLDMELVGHNPARLISALASWFDVYAPAGGPIRAVGEPIRPGRSAAEMVEMQRHEALVNVALGWDRDVRLLCLYDVEALPEPVVDAAVRSHPSVARNGISTPSPTYRADEMAAAFADVPLPEPAVPFRELEFGFEELHVVRAIVAMTLDATAMSRHRSYDLLLAVSEVATNSVIHGGGAGMFRIWVDADTVVCEFRDSGHLTDPLVGRLPPPLESFGQRGLWIVNHLCDLVQIRTFPSGTVVRLHMAAS